MCVVVHTFENILTHCDLDMSCLLLQKCIWVLGKVRSKDERRLVNYFVKPFMQNVKLQNIFASHPPYLETLHFGAVSTRHLPLVLGVVFCPN